MSLHEAKNEQAFLKAGIFGFQGSGKTFTATNFAIGMHKYIKSKKPIAFLDTETGSSYVMNIFKEAGIKLVVDKTRAFIDLLADIREAEKTSDILIIDSITHFWREFVDAYLRANRLKFIRIQDWGKLKSEWQKYTDLYINSNIHVIMCGRAGNVFSDVSEDGESETKSWRAVKVGTKMSAETETGYEPSLLMEMSKVFDDKKDKSGSYTRRCHVIKDRFNIIDSAQFDDPTFDNILPHVKLLNIGGEQMGVDVTRTSDSLFDSTGDLEKQRIAKRKEIALEELQSVFVKAGLSTSSEESKKRKIDILEKTFGTSSKTKIESLEAAELENGLNTIIKNLAPTKQDEDIKQ
jgi:hypothetical protein